MSEDQRTGPEYKTEQGNRREGAALPSSDRNRQEQPEHRNSEENPEF
ncbi:hypothetical protein ACRAWG_17050 [Methylobacterium sp. P31]